RLEVRLLGPDPARPREHVDRAGTGCGVVGRVAGAAGFIDRTDGQAIAGHRHRGAELVTGLEVRRLEVALRVPAHARAGEDIDRTRIRRGAVVRVAGGGAVVPRRTDGQGVLGQRDRLAELILRSDVRCLDVRLLAPDPVLADEDIDRTRARRGVVVRVG